MTSIFDSNAKLSCIINYLQIHNYENLYFYIINMVSGEKADLGSLTSVE